MITDHPLDAACPLPTCLHQGPLPWTACDVPTYVETVSDLPGGTVVGVSRQRHSPVVAEYSG